MALTKNEIAKRIAQELVNNTYVNLGIGIPTLVANHVPSDINVEFQSENGNLCCLLLIKEVPVQNAFLSRDGQLCVFELPIRSLLPQSLFPVGRLTETRKCWQCPPFFLQTPHIIRLIVMLTCVRKEPFCFRRVAQPFFMIFHQRFIFLVERQMAFANIFALHTLKADDRFTDMHCCIFVKYAKLAIDRAALLKPFQQSP